MNKNKKWYSLFLVLLISLGTVIQPIQAVASVVTMDTVTEETQTKTIETPIVDNDVKETSQTEEVTEVSTEEPQSTNTEEVVESSEVIDEKIEKEEVTVESSSEEVLKSSTKEKLKLKRSVTGAPKDIKEYLEGSEKFLSDVLIKVTSGGKEIDYTKDAIPSNALISLDYKFAIPERLLLLEDKPLKEGDFYEISLPKDLKVSNFGGPLVNEDKVDFGTYSVVDGKIRIVFNKQVEVLERITGTVKYSEHLEEKTKAGENLITIPVEDGEKNVDVVVKPKGGHPIIKKARKANDNKTVNWDVSINMGLEQLNNAVVTDVMPEGLKLKNVTIWEQQVNLNGEVISVSDTPLVEGKDYTKNGDQITFTGVSNKSYKITYETIVDEGKIPVDGGTVTHINEATLSNNNVNKTAKDQVSFTYGKLIDKKLVEEKGPKTEQVYKWHIEYNGGEKNLPKGNFITDKLSGIQVYKQESLVIKSKTKTYNKGTDYTVSFDDANKEMKIEFSNGLSEKVEIDYQTEVPVIVDGNLQDYNLGNTVTTDSKFSAYAEGAISREGLIKDGDVDHNEKKIHWNIEVNRFKYELNNWTMSDNMTAGLTFDPTTFKIIDKDSKEELKATTDYVLESTGTSFNVKFVGKYAKTSQTFVITYTTDYSTYQVDEEERHAVFTNTAETNWKDVNKENHSDKVIKDIPVNSDHVNNAKKTGKYNGASKKISWEVIVNYNQEVLKNGTIVDPIKGNQDYVAESGKLYEAGIDKNGYATRGAEVEGAVSYKDKTVVAKLPENTSKAYVLVFETSLEGKIIEGETYENKATFENNGRKKEVSDSVKPHYSGVFAQKRGKQDDNNKNYVNWDITINQSQSTLKNVELIDEPSPNQIIDEKSIVIYGTTVASNEYIGKNEEVVLERNKDYSIDITTDNITGQQVLTVKFLKEISSAYILEYRTLINSSKVEDTVSNKFSFKGENEKVIKTNTSFSKKVITSNGSADGVSTGVKIVKLDANSKIKTPLEGAHFELRNKQGQVLRSGVTDVKGELRFGNLRSNYEYVLFETKAPTGFSVSEELRKGKKIKLKRGTSLNQFETLELKNDIPRIHLTKIDENGSTPLAKAEFVIKNAKGEFYKGFDKTNKAVWAKNQDEAEKIISDNSGSLEVIGLEAGTYSAEEIKAPVGYDKLTDDVSFEVVDDLGWIRLKTPVTISNKEYEKIAVNITKNWDDNNDQDGKRPTKLTFDLLANGNKIKELEVTGGQDNVWVASFPDLRKFDENMKEIVYTIVEHDVALYTKSDVKKEQNTNNFSITNTHKPEQVSILANKHWDDNNNQDGLRPTNIVVHLMAKIKGEENAVSVENIRVDHSSNWSYTFKEQPKYRDGKEVIYTVEEEAVIGYTVAYSKIETKELPKDVDYGFDIKNTHIPATTRILVEKDWKDNRNQDGKRPKEIVVQLIGNDKEIKGKKIKLEASKNWQAKFDKLPLKQNGKEIAYKVKEVIDEEAEELGYTPSYDIKKVVTKKAEDNKNRNEESYIEAKITNLRDIDPTVVSGTKTWSDDNNRDGVRPTEIKVQLLADGQPALDRKGEKVPVKPVTGGNTSTEWHYEFKDIPKHRTVEEGKEAKKAEEIIYTVQEVELTAKGYTAVETGMDVTNSRDIDLTKVSGTKTWSDDNNRDGVRPTEIKVQLLADGKPALDKDGKEIPVKAVTGGETSTEWNYEFTDLPVNKAVKAGEDLLEESERAINYTVREVELTAKGYTAVETGMDVTNSRDIDLTKVSGTKIWSDDNNRDGVRPTEIKVQLLADGKPALDKDGKEIPVKAVTGGKTSTEWNYEFTELPVNKAVKADEDLLEESERAINYTVKEVIDEELTAKGYTAVETGMDVTNSRDIDLTEISGVKVWEDNENRSGARPTKIEIQLLADGQPALDKDGEEIPVKAVTGGETSTEWNYEFTDLPVNKAVKADDELREVTAITYSVKEVISDTLIENGYVAKEEGMNVTNTREVISVPVTKIWNDYDNKDGIRPEDITVKLLANGKQAKDVAGKEIVATISGDMKSNKWSYEFKDLPKLADEKEIKYTIEEINISNGYEAAYSEDTFTITNTHTPKEVLATDKKSKNTLSNLPKTGEVENANLTNLGITMIMLFLMRFVSLNQRRKSRKN